MMFRRPTSRSSSPAAYGESYYTIGRLSAKHVQRVLLGADPGDLPVEQVDRLHFVINLTTAKALGLTIPNPCWLGRMSSLSERTRRQTRTRPGRAAPSGRLAIRHMKIRKGTP
jgi:putative ABC transport system substrate-binding protein